MSVFKRSRIQNCWLVAGLLLTCFACTRAAGQSDAVDGASVQVFNKLKTEALQRSSAYSYLKQLTLDIGPRLTGSPEAEKACLWAQRKMEVIGLKNVHLEHWDLARGWQRGVAQAQLVSPFRLPLNVTSYGWSGSTPAGGVEAEVVVVNSDRLEEEARENAAKWAGKLLLLEPAQPRDPLRSYAQLADFARIAATAHAVAIMKRYDRPGVMLTHTEPLSFPLTYHDSLRGIAVLDIALEHQKLIAALLKSHKSVRIRIEITNRFSSGPLLRPTLSEKSSAMSTPSRL